MATPTRTRHCLDLAGGPVEVDLVASARAGRRPLVILPGAAGTALGERALLRLARAGFAAIGCGRVEPRVMDALVDLARAGGVGGILPSSLGVVLLPGAPGGLPSALASRADLGALVAWPAGEEDEALDVVVRTLAARLT